MIDILNHALAKLRSGEDFVMVTVVDATGSVPGRPGARILVFQAETVGTIGGGAIEKLAIDRARELLKSDEKTLLVEQKTAELGMRCGGKAQLFMEAFRAAPHLWLFGGGHVAKALAPICSGLGFRVVVADNRPEFASQERFPEAIRTVCGDYTQLAKTVNPGSFVVIATHGHTHDQQVLTEVVQLDPSLPYIGMIGSKKKVPKAIAELREKGIDPGPNFYSPIGLDLGGGAPADIALSIASELLAVRNGKAQVIHCREKIVK